MSGSQPFTDLHGVIQNLAKVRNLRKSSQRVSLNIFHGDKGSAFVFANLVNGNNVRVVKGGSSFGLMPETSVDIRVFGKTGRQEFQSDFSVQFGVLGKIDFTHPALAKFF